MSVDVSLQLFASHLLFFLISKFAARLLVSFEAGSMVIVPGTISAAMICEGRTAGDWMLGKNMNLVSKSLHPKGHDYQYQAFLRVDAPNLSCY